MSLSQVQNETVPFQQNHAFNILRQKHHNSYKHFLSILKNIREVSDSSNIFGVWWEGRLFSRRLFITDNVTKAGCGQSLQKA